MSIADARDRLAKAAGAAGYYSRRDVGDLEKATAAAREAEFIRVEIQILKALAEYTPTPEQRERLAGLLLDGAK